MNIFPSIFSKNPINVCWNPQNMDHFSKTINLRGHMPRFTLKMNVFPSISWETPEMCVETLRTVLIFPRWSIWGVTCLGLVGKWMFSYLCPWKHHKCVLEPSEQGSFFQVDQFHGSHASVYSKNEHFPISLLRIPINVCWNHWNSAHFPRRSIWGVTYLGLVEKWMFSHLCPWKHHKCVLKPLEQCSFFQSNWFEGSHASVYSKNEHFPIYLLKKPHKCVLKPSEQCSFFQDDQFEGSHA